MLINSKKKEIKELFNKLEQRHKEILEKKSYYVYEPSLTSNTLIKDFEKEFWIMTKLNKCANCGAISAKFKKFNNVRFFRIMPSNKEKKRMAKIGIDVEKGALEHGVNKREKEKNKKEKKNKKKEEDQNIDPTNSTIISSKNHKKLTWYLIYKYNKNNSKQKPDENNYSNYHWVAGNIIRREKLKNFNTFEDDEKKIMELNQYIFDLQKKLEKKEESISKLDYKNKKLNEQIQNKTAGVKGGDFVLSRISDSDKNKVKNNFANSISSNDGGINEMEKFKKILEQLNDSNKRETLLHNEIKELKTKLQKKEEFESGIPQDLKNIDNRSVDSGFLDEDFKQSHNEGVLNFIKESQNRINNNKNQDIIISTRTERESIS